MIRFQDLPLRRKLLLVIVGTAAFVLLVASSAFFVYDSVSYRKQMERDLVTLAEIIASNSAAAVEFTDPEAARDTLASLRLRPNIVSTYVILADGSILASYKRDESEVAAEPIRLERPGVRTRGNRMIVARNIEHRGERIGSVLLRADTAELAQRFHDYALTVALLMVGCVAVAVVLGLWLQRLLSRPIVDLAAAAKLVSRDRDFSIRVTQSARDEIGTLAEEFNDMLGEIEQRDVALSSAQRELQARVADLQREVGERQSIEEALRSSELQLRHLAFHDLLTELPNRVLFNDHLKLALAQRRREPGTLAVLFIDLDRFKVINDSLGHTFGDDVLREVGTRISATVRKGDTVARLGGDEFILLLPDLTDSADAARTARKLLRAIREPFAITGRNLFVTASIGVAIYPVDGEDGETLIKNADTAMYRAKQAGRDNYQLYTPEMHREALRRITLETELRSAVRNEEFRVYYQPVVDLADGTIVAAEALVRWQHPERGLVAPGEFIEIAEETGLINPIGAWVIRNATSEAARWRSASPIRLSVNLSPRQFQDRNFAERLCATVRERGMDPSQIYLEITESMAIEDDHRTMDILDVLRGDGFRVVIDDFGTGYSSLGYLKRFPFDGLKLDRRFLRDIETDHRDAALTRAIIALAQGLGVELTAEGVETEKQRELLVSSGCRCAQGYLFSRPVEAVAFRALLEQGGFPRVAPASLAVP